VRELTRKHWIVAVLLFLMPQLANAVGLGRMNVLSALGQPFSAEIELVNLQPGEVASLTTRLASPDDYQKANLQYNAVLTGLRLSLDKRPNGVLFIRASSTRPVAEPFLDLLIELQWAGGRIVREYSALLDPPGADIPPPIAAAPVPSTTTPITRPAPAPKEPASAPAPARAPAAVAPAAPSVPSVPAGNEYTVKPGDTMGRIAASVKPDGVSLEQALLGIFRGNPDAFINNNINLVRSGKILRVPGKDQMAAVPQAEATRELRVQTENWNAYRQKVADAAAPAPDAKPATSGKIIARVDDKAATEGAKDVVRLSKGGDAAAALGKGGKPSGADRVRALEEELVAREKALAEANDRVKQLEKTLKDMQKLVELKGAAVAPKPDAKGEVPKPADKAEPPKMEPAKPEPAKPADTPAEKAPEPKSEPPKVDKAAEKAPVKPKTPLPPPKPEPDLMDMVMDNILPIGGGAAVLAGLGAFWALRRRKKDSGDDDEQMSFVPAPKKEPSVAAGAAVVGAAAATAAAADAAAPAAVASEAVDPMEEAQVYLDHGRDVQAEEILKEAMQKDPAREDLQLKLLEIYAGRNDKGAFNSLATGYHALTGGQGDGWARVEAMGYALDPENALYALGKDAAVDVTAGAESSTGPNLDFDIGGDAGADMGSTTDIELDAGVAGEDMDKTQIVNRGDVMSTHDAPEAGSGKDHEPITMFNLELPESEPKEAAPAAAVTKPAEETGGLDFNIDLNSLDAPAATVKTAAAAPAPADDGGLDFKVDFGDIDLKLDDKAAVTTPAVPVGEAKDAHWEDVQQKFDLARAYQEMGDKDGAREILQEVMREGSEQQKADAEKLITSLS
jgi:pilus assembly protein FimV